MICQWCGMLGPQYKQVRGSFAKQNWNALEISVYKE